MLKVGIRWLYFTLAVVSLALGIIGAFVPILPTVPFILLSAWAAAKSSPRLLAWLEGHSRYGKHIHDWRMGGVVSRKAKWAATSMMSLSAVIILLTVPGLWGRVLSVGTMALVGIWLWQRPEHLPGDPSSSQA